MSETLVIAENVSKKFSRSLKHLMLYGMQDMVLGVFGKGIDSGKLRDNEFWAVDGASFELKRGETLGMIGPNGSGKTTALKMLNGIFMPDRGKISVRGRVGVLIHVGAGFHPMLTGRENVYVNGTILGMRKKEIDRKFDSIVDFADIGDFLDTPVKNYSSGMYVRLGFSIAMHCDPDVLLVDEVLSVGDAGFQAKCLNEIGRLRKNGTAIVLVSHELHHISVHCNKVTLFQHGKTKNFDDVSEGIKEYVAIFSEEEDSDTRKNTSGNDKIRFFGESVNKRLFSPGDDLTISIKYSSIADYEDVVVDIALMSSNESKFHFEATNEAYGKRVDLKKGDHELNLTVKDVRINSAAVRIGVLIWSKNKYELLLWWELPVKYAAVAHTTGQNFLDVVYNVN